MTRIIVTNRRNFSDIPSIHGTYVMTYQRRTAFSCVLLASLAMSILLMVVIKKKATKISSGILIGLIILCTCGAWIFFTLTLKIDFQKITLSHVFKTRRFRFTKFKSIHPVHEENWLDDVRSNDSYYLLIKFSGWKLSKRIPLTGWYYKKEKLSHNTLCAWICHIYNHHHPGRTQVFPE